MHGDGRWLEENERHAPDAFAPILGGIASAEEERALAEVSARVRELGLAEGQLCYDHADERTGEQVAVFDLVWPDGLRAGLTEPVALLLNEEERTIALANAAGLRCFTDVGDFKAHVVREVTGSSELIAEHEIVETASA